MKGSSASSAELLPLTGRVLDVGCGRAAFERSHPAAGLGGLGHRAKRRGVPCGAGTRPATHPGRPARHQSSRGRAGATHFDGLVFSDVLEHVYDPLGVLGQYLRFVKPSGRVFISLPNAVVWTNRARILCGRVDYADTGVMDRTHIRFFTFRTARRLVEAAGCRVERVNSTPYLVRSPYCPS